MIDPVTGGVLAGLILAAIIFSYFARQGNDDKKYDKLAKESARLLLQDKKPAPKPKVNKNKKEKKGDKKTSDAQQEKIKKESDSEGSEDTVEAVVEAKKKESSPVENEPKGKKGKQNKKDKGSPRNIPSEEQAEHVEATAVPVEPEVIEEIIVKKEEAPVEEVSPPSQPPKKAAPKKKKKPAGPPPHDLDEHKVLGRLADIEEIEAEYVAYLAQYFTDVNEKTTQMTMNVSGLEKNLFDLRQKAEGHCAARMHAEKEAQALQRQSAELARKITQLEKDLEHNKQQAELFKKKAAESSALVVVNADATAEVQRLRQTEHAHQQQIQKLNQQVKEWQTKAEQSLKEAQTLRSTQESNKGNQEELHKLQEELQSRDSTIAQVRAEFNDLETMTRDLIAEKENLEKLVPTQEMIPKKFAEATEDALRTLKLEMKDKSKELVEKEQQWSKKESALMVEQKRLAALVESLQQEIAKFTQFKEEKTKLEARLAESETELAKARAALSNQEIFVSAEDGLKAENAVLKSELLALRTELSSLKSTHEKELKAIEARAVSSAEEVVVLRKTNDQLQAAPTPSSANHQSGEEIERLLAENNRLNEKNEELRARNHAVVGHVHELEKRLGSGGGGSAASSGARVSESSSSQNNHKKTSEELEEERTLVATALQSIGNLPKLPQGADKKKYSKWLNDVSTSLKKRLEAPPPSSASANENGEEVYKQALHRLSNELASIERAWSEQATKYEKEIDSYKKKLGQQAH